MYKGELHITPHDWFGVLLIGVVFSAFLSVLGYYILNISIIHGALFGIILGFFITLYSLVFISAMNRYLLPHIHKRWWNVIAALFSFLSGFLGTLSTYVSVSISSLIVIDLLHLHPFKTASIIGVLSYLIGAMIYSFVKTRNEKEYIDTLFVQSRVRSLETQLNPHFLYNALNSLAELIHQDPNKAEAAVLKISTFLRNTMGEKPLIPLRDELRNVADYIDLENIRFGGRISLSILGEEIAMSILIPKFSIQLLCENGIKHGFDTSSSDFQIKIEITNTDHLHIDVSNNGRPIRHSQFGIGLSNLQERLSYLCNGTLTIESLDPATYSIKLKVCHENIDC
ncbi:histidine kinase [Sulfuricurvum sp.]|uniref:sensor histidine kinase n=1 Tax=Sulfuricurvum sp. TaxID=2025608 RepID=UPI0026106160|nr:histidine kinase [Sulfuricurvum sp.]MDD4950436.1 histidine kinase [Sulfuricurvum sp.]